MNALLAFRKIVVLCLCFVPISCHYSVTSVYLNSAGTTDGPFISIALYVITFWLMWKGVKLVFTTL